MPYQVLPTLFAVSLLLAAFSAAFAAEERRDAGGKAPTLVRIARAGNGAAEKSAFEAAKELGTVAAWDAFLSNYPTGLYADLARAYLKKASGNGGAKSQKEERRVAFSCNEGIPLIVTFVDEANESYALYSHDSGPTVRLPVAVSGSGFSYSDGYHELRGKGHKIDLIEGGDTIDSCTAD